MDYKLEIYKKYCRGRRVLDLGCSGAPFGVSDPNWRHRHIVEISQGCIGIDNKEERIQTIMRLFPEYDVRLEDATCCDIGEVFDVVLASDLIEHVSNAGGLAESANRHLEPGGVFLVSTPNHLYYRFLIKRLLNRNLKPNEEHVCWYCPETLRQLMRRFGFEASDPEVYTN